MTRPSKYLSVFSWEKLFYIILYHFFNLSHLYFFEISTKSKPSIGKYTLEYMFSVLYGLNGCGDDMKSHFIWDVNFKHAPNEKVPSLGF